ncbi:MAG: TonB-dependent receptor [Gammaproteobacteria bacterium]
MSISSSNSANHTYTALSALLALSLLFSHDIVAQDEGFMLEEVVVTARKREESLQDTPIAVSAFTARDLEFRQVSSTDQLGDITPNLTFDNTSPSSGSSSAAQIFIRGIGQTDFTPVTDPGVGLYIDGVYMARSVGNVLDFLDVERVEILKGPQGTLFGRNTIGGAVAIHSKRPTDTPEMSLKGQFGDDSMVYVTATASGPLADGVAANLAYSFRNRDGYVERPYDGVDLGDDDSNAIRGSLLLDPAENLQAYVTFDYSRIRENGAPNVSAGVGVSEMDPVNGFGLLGNALLPDCEVIEINDAYMGRGNPGLENPTGPGSPGGWERGTAPAAPAAISEALVMDPDCYGPDRNAGPYTSEGTFPVQSHLDVWGFSGEFTWEINEWFGIKSITSYREVEMTSSRDGDHTPANIFATVDWYDHKQFSQEIQLSGVMLDNQLQWLVGGYYFQEDGSNINPVTLPVGAIQSGGLYDNDSLALFFQSTYSVTEQLDLTFGVRYTDDNKRFTPDQIAYGDASAGVSSPFDPTWPLWPDKYSRPGGPALDPGDRILPFVEAKRSFDDVSIMANIAYHLTDQVMTYFTYSQGYKSGGFDQRYAGPPPSALPQEPSGFDPETATSYELGLKSQFLNDTVRLNAAIFHTDYTELQIIIRQTFNPVTFNGGDAKITGGEAELTWVATERFLMTAAIGYMDARYKTLNDSVSGSGNSAPVLPHYKLVNTPKWSAAIGAAYTFDFSNWATLTPRLDWSYHGEQYNNAVNTPQLRQESYSLLNAGVAMQTNDGKWEALLALRNITDKAYIITGNSGAGTASSYIAQVYGRPFEWSVSLKYNFF